MKVFAVYLADDQNSSELQEVILDKNSLFDEGIREMMLGMYDRFLSFNNLEKQNFNFESRHHFSSSREQ